VDFSMSLVTEDGECRLRLHGELDLVSITQVRDGVTQVIASGTTRLTLDLADLVFIDSTGIGELVRARGRAHSHGVEYRVVGAQGQVAQVLETVGVIDYLRGDGQSH
jgi:anti-sigma B factor antagonist